MNKHSILLLLSYLFFSIEGYTQSNITSSIKGQIIDNQHKAIELATIFLLDRDSSFIQSTSSATDGGFIFVNLLPNTYIIQISFLGYKKTYVSISTIENENILPPIMLETDEKILNEITITKAKPIIEKKIDRIIFNIENSPTLSGSTAWEALSKSPGITVDQQGNVSILGKKGVMIYINNKPIQLSAEEVSNLLKNWSADDLSKIEIITNPPAKYDAQGVSGIINIQTKKSKMDGLNGSARLGYEHWFYPKSNGGINLNFRNKNLNIYGNYSSRFAKSFRRDYATIYYPTATFDEVDTLISYQQAHTYKMGLDYYFGKNIIGVLTDGNIADKLTDLSALVNLLDPLSSILNSYFYTKNSDTDPSGQFSTNLNYKRIIEKDKKELNVDVDYSSFFNIPTQYSITHQYNTKNLEIGKAIENKSIDSQYINIASAKIDYITPFLNGKLESGGKATMIQATNNYLFENQVNGIYENDTTKSNQFLYTETTQAIYTNFSKEMNKINFQIGLRGEHTTSMANSVTLKKDSPKDYFMLFPTTYIQYMPSQYHEWSISYGRRVTRPGYQSLNPFRMYTNPYIYVSGNLYLTPYFAHLIELSYTYQQKFIFSLYFQNIKNGISHISYQDNTNNIIAYYPTNLTNSLEYGFTSIIPFDPFPWWSVNLTNSVFRQHDASDYLNTNFVLTRWVYTTTITQSFVISKKYHWKGEIIANYSSPNISGIYQNRYSSDISLGLQKKVLSNNGTISINISDLLYTNWYGGNLNYRDQNNTILIKFESRVIRINFTYNFGKNTVKSFRNRKFGNEEERNRSGN